MWPTPQDYNEAIQNPRAVFNDPDLQSGQPVLTRLGLPRPITGAFASVYEVDCGSKRWAVRCFLREFTDQRDRYARISDHLSRMPLPFMTPFTYLHEGIRIKNAWYPILKMEWVRGEQLNEYVARNLGNRRVLAQLCSDWMTVLSQLRQAGIAHGDLQHGNVLIDGGRIRLIDYDGMYVPSLSGRVSHEQGHRNYQHPRRTGNDFGPGIDNFSAWVIFVSLAALAIHPPLWKELNGGDECLIFRATDFENPERSAAFRALAQCDDAYIKMLPSRLASFAKLPLSQIAPLDGAISPPAVRDPRLLPGGGWIADHLPEGRAPDQQTRRLGRQNKSPAGAAWIIDHLLDAEPANTSVTWEDTASLRTWLAAFVGLSSLFIGTAAVALNEPLLLYCLLFVPVGITAMIYQGYRLQPCHERRRECLDNIASAQEANTQAQADLKALAIRAKRARTPLLIIQEKCRDEEQRVREAIQILEAKRTSAREEGDHERAQIDSWEKTRCDELGDRLRSSIADLQHRLGGLQSAETSEIARRAQEHAEQIVVGHLVAAKIRDAQIPGIFAGLVDRLDGSGFRTARDVERGNVRRVEQIGPKRADALEAWARNIRRTAQQSAACKLPESTRRQIHASYSSQRSRLTAEIEELRRNHERQAKDVSWEAERFRESLAARLVSSKQEIEARSDHVKNEWVKRKSQMDIECTVVEKHVRKQMRIIKKSQRRLQDALFASKLRLAKAQREMLRHSHFTLARFTSHLFGLGRHGRSPRSTSGGQS